MVEVNDGAVVMVEWREVDKMVDSICWVGEAINGESDVAENIDVLLYNAVNLLNKTS